MTDITTQFPLPWHVGSYGFDIKASNGLHVDEICSASDEDGDKKLAALICRAVNRFAGWQPIETAPKDGTQILVVYEGRARVAAYGKTSHVPLYGFCLADQGPEDFDLVEVDMWQPLPAPPVVSKTEAER